MLPILRPPHATSRNSDPQPWRPATCFAHPEASQPQPNRAQGLGDRGLHRVDLVVACHLGCVNRRESRKSRFNTKLVANIPIPIKPLAEQHRIVARVDTLIAEALDFATAAEIEAAE